MHPMPEDLQALAEAIYQARTRYQDAVDDARKRGLRVAHAIETVEHHGRPLTRLTVEVAVPIAEPADRG